MRAAWRSRFRRRPITPCRPFARASAIRSSIRSNVPTDYEPTQPWILPLAAAQGSSADIRSSDWLIRRVCAPDPEIREELVARGFDFAVGLTDGMSRSLHGVAL